MKNKQFIYFDNNATSFVAPEVWSYCEELNNSGYGNPSSMHNFGRISKNVIIHAKSEIHKLLGANESDIIFTSGATEALNSVISSLPNNSHIITSSLEHAAVIEPLKKSNTFVSFLDVLPGEELITPEQIENAIREDTFAIVIGYANTETGIKNNLEDIGKIAKKYNIKLIIDAASVVGKESWKIPEEVDAICFSGHKFHALQGIGCAIVKPSLQCFKPLIVGAPQQNGKRAGTENTLGIASIGKAAELANKSLPNSCNYINSLRKTLEDGLSSELTDIIIHGKNKERLCNTSNIAFPGIDAESLIISLDLKGVQASLGSSCSSGFLKPSSVLIGMKIPMDLVNSSIRISLCRYNTMEQMHKAVDIISTTVKKMRQNN